MPQTRTPLKVSKATAWGLLSTWEYESWATRGIKYVRFEKMEVGSPGKYEFQIAGEMWKEGPMELRKYEEGSSIEWGLDHMPKAKGIRIFKVEDDPDNAEGCILHHQLDVGGMMLTQIPVDQVFEGIKEFNAQFKAKVEAAEAA